MRPEDFQEELGRLCREYTGNVSGSFPEELKEIMERTVQNEMIPVFELERIKRKENLTTPEVSLLYGESEAALRKLRFEGRGPKFIKRGSKVLYRNSDLQEYYKARIVRTSDQPS